jgi:hypothetical protein
VSQVVENLAAMDVLGELTEEVVARMDAVTSELAH